MVMEKSMKVIPALILLAFSGAASASGFQLTEQNASGLGNAYAGQAAVAENASTIFFNPAGMTQLQDREFSLGLAAIGPTFNFHDNGSKVGSVASGGTTGGLMGTGEGGNAGGWAALPNGYLSWALSKNLYVGVGVGAPFGLKTEYDNPWVGAAQSTMFDITTYNVNPSIAYRVSDQVSLGFGVNWQHVEATYDRQLGVTTLGSGARAIPGSVAVRSPLRLTLDDDSWGWNAGALFTLSPATRIGVSYRSTIEYKTTGNIAVTGPVSAVNAATSSGARADIKMPDTFSLAVTQQLSDRWQMLGDLTWTGWSSIPRVDIYRTSGAGNGTIAQVLDTESGIPGASASVRPTSTTTRGSSSTVSPTTRLRSRAPARAWSRCPTTTACGSPSARSGRPARPRSSIWAFPTSTSATATSTITRLPSGVARSPATIPAISGFSAHSTLWPSDPALAPDSNSSAPQCGAFFMPTCLTFAFMAV